MKKLQYAMLFCRDLALLSSICNKQTMFFAGMIHRMDSDHVVQMTPYVRKKLISEVGSKTGNPSNLARQYLKGLSDAGLVASLGDGAYMVNPKIAGFTNIASIVDAKSEVFLKIKYSPDGSRELSVTSEKTPK